MLNGLAGTVVTVVVLAMAFVVMAFFYSKKEALLIMLVGCAGCIIMSLFTLESELLDAISKMALISPAFILILRTHDKYERECKKKQDNNDHKNEQ